MKPVLELSSAECTCTVSLLTFDGEIRDLIILVPNHCTDFNLQQCVKIFKVSIVLTVIKRL